MPYKLTAASFVVLKNALTAEERQAFLDYNISRENVDGWTIEEDNDGSIHGHTTMDNDALDDYLERIGFDVRKMEWRQKD